MKFIIVITFLFLNTFALAYNKKSECSLTELSLKNCPLSVYGFKLHFLDDKVLVHDGIWRTIERMPLVGEKTDWEKIKVTRLGDKIYVEFYIWTEPFGEVEVQNLKWYVYLIEQQKMSPLAENIVRKRSRDFDKPNRSFKYDKKIKHQLMSKKGQAYILIQGKEQKVPDPK